MTNKDVLYSAFCSIKRPGLNFPQKVSLTRPGLSQILRASVHENQKSIIHFEKVSIKRPVLSQFQILEALNDHVL